MATRSRGNKRAREDETSDPQQGGLLNEWRQVHKDKRQAETIGRKSALSKAAAQVKPAVGSKAIARSPKTAKTSQSQTAAQGSASPGSIERFLTKTRRQKDQQIAQPENVGGGLDTAPAFPESVDTNRDHEKKDTGAGVLPNRKEEAVDRKMSEERSGKEVRLVQPSEDAMEICEEKHPQPALNTRKPSEMTTEERSAGSLQAPLHASPKKGSRRAIALMQAAQAKSPSKSPSSSKAGAGAGAGSAADEALDFLNSEKRISFAERARTNAEKGVRSSVPPRRAINRALIPSVLERNQRIAKIERMEKQGKVLRFELPAEKEAEEEVEVKEEEVGPKEEVVVVKREGEEEVKRERKEIRSKADLRALLPAVLDEEQALMLPQRFHRLVQQFDCLDTALSFAKSRHRSGVYTWPEMRKNVESLLKRDFPLDNLRQICAVCPHAYQLYWVDLGKGITLALNFSSPPPSSASSSSSSSSRPTPSALRERKEEFRAALVEHVRQQHGVFLSKLRPKPPAPPPGMRHTAWHPDFIVEHVRDIEPAALPKQPQQLEEEKREREEEGKLTKAAEGASDAVTNALSHLLAKRKEEQPGGSGESKSEGGGAEGEEQRPKKEEVRKERKELAGLSSSLIEKVRARERASKEAAEAAERKRAGRKKTAACVSEHSVSLLLEMMHSFFRLRGPTRRAIPLTALANQLVAQHSDSTVTRDEICTQIKWIVEELPTACAIAPDPMDGTPIFQLAPSFDLQAARSVVLGRLG